MLTREELFHQAELRNLPLGKERAILREYLHYSILDSINSLSDQLVLTSGTALRLVYNFGRFSLDLDFDAVDLNFKTFQKVVEQLVSDLGKLGFSANPRKFKTSLNILTSEVKFPGFFPQYNIDTFEELMIKIEVLNVSAKRLKKEVKLLRNFDGKAIVANVLKKEFLATEKIAAFFQRARERDYYDVFFLVFNKFPIDLALLNELLTPKYLFDNHEKLIEVLKERFLESDMEKISLKLEPFLIDPRHLDFLRNPEAIKQIFIL